MPDVRLSRLDLNSAGALRREPPRLVGQRQPDYEASFDFRTVFYDCFSSVDGRRLICIGPPLANLARAVLPAILRAFKKSMFSRAEIRRLDRVCQLAFRPGSANAVLSGDLFEQRALAPQPNHCDWFRGRRVLTAISKDNHLDWIRDWAEFYVRWHGCDAVLLYDNGSTQYESAKVRDVLRAIPGVDLAVVVDWRFPIGPSGGGNAARSRTGPNGEQLAIWDSDFCQYGFLEHAHQRFLLSAAAVLSVDIDELVITAGRESIFDLAQQSRTGYVNFSGIWIENAAIDDAGEARRHRQYIYRNAPMPRPTAPKWAVAPSRCTSLPQWCVHWIAGLTSDSEASSKALHRHFSAITTNWKSRRWVPERPGAAHQVDQELVEWFKAASRSPGEALRDTR
jgi:hypothetical protein